jgi:hypothetical protein
MAHLYDKAPPAFAKDPWAWDYTRDRMEGNTGLPYDQWQGKHFAGAAAMYKNVVKKYGTSVENGVLTVPKDCIDCGQVNQHYQNDYVCKSCRDAIEAAGSYQEAAQTISNPGSLDAIREALYKSLGHDKKDAAKGRTKQWGAAQEASATVTVENPVVDALDQHEAERRAYHDAAVRTLSTGVENVSRNYSRMGNDKLSKAISDLEAGILDPKYSAKGETAENHYEAALRVAQEKGLL